MTTEMKHLIFKNIFRDDGKLQALTATHVASKIQCMIKYDKWRTVEVFL